MITATQGGYFPIDPAPLQVLAGDSVVIVLSTSHALESCNNRTRPVDSVAITVAGNNSSTVTLDHVLEKACEYGYRIGIAG